MKRLNFETGKPFKSGDVRSDGYVFKSYWLKKIKQNGYYWEKWYSPAVFEKEQIKDKDRREKNKQINSKRSLNWYYVNKNRILGYKKEYYQETKDVRLATNKEYRKNNPEKVLQVGKNYRLKNLAIVNAKNRTRRASKNNRTPLWLTDIDHERIQNEYKLAYILGKITGQKWEVDHVIPLQGEFVSGFHVPSNLRAILAFENRSKHNRYDAIKLQTTSRIRNCS